jgi:trehalose-6-phosphate synthase
MDNFILLDNRDEQLQNYKKNKSNDNLDFDKKSEEFVINLSQMEEIQIEIQEIVDSIHLKYGSTCLILKHEFLVLEERCALWSSSHCYLNTSLYEGAIVTPFEFISVKNL